MKLQSAIEYITTYGWAILVLAIVLSALYMLGVFNNNSFAPNVCSFPANIGCISANLFQSGNLIVNIEQSTQNPINITAIGCNTNGTPSDMNTIKPQIYLQIGANQTFKVQCYASNTIFSGSPGTLYTGYLILNYTDVQSGFQHVVVGKLVQKVV